MKWFPLSSKRYDGYRCRWIHFTVSWLDEKNESLILLLNVLCPKSKTNVIQHVHDLLAEQDGKLSLPL